MKWKAGMEENGLRVNMGKIKLMSCRVGSGTWKWYSQENSHVS